MDIFKYNGQAWDHEVARGSAWSIPVSPEQIQSAKDGVIEIILSPGKRVPADWLLNLEGKDVLRLPPKLRPLVA